MCRMVAGGSGKEVHYFDQAPLGPIEDYLHCFPEQKREEALKGKPTVLVDLSPDYMRVSRLYRLVFNRLCLTIGL